MHNRKGEFDFVPRHLLYWILIGVCVIIIWLIVQGLIDKVLAI